MIDLEVGFKSLHCKDFAKLPLKNTPNAQSVTRFGEYRDGLYRQDRSVVNDLIGQGFFIFCDDLDDVVLKFLRGQGLEQDLLSQL